MITNTRLIPFKVFHDTYGSLIPLEVDEDIPFKIERAYYIFDVGKDIRRGFHSHKELEQVLVCVHGSVKILVKTPFESEDIVLDKPDTGLYIGPAVWREMYDFSPDAVLMVFASKHYNTLDYIRNYEDYVSFAKEYFDKKGKNKFCRYGGHGLND